MVDCRFAFVVVLVPDFKERIPGSGADGHAVLGDAQTRHPVVVSGQDAGALHPQRVPDVDVEVVVTGHEEPARLGEGDGRDAADDVVVRILSQFLVCADVVELDGGVVGAGAEGGALREEGDGVDIALVAGEGLLADALADVPQLGGGVARAGDERPVVGAKGQGHHVARVTAERLGLLASLDVP